MKKILSTLTAITLLAGATAINASAFTPSSYATDLKVYLNGENVYAGSENQPCIMNDRTMVQIRPIFEKLGYTAEYNDATKTAIFYGGSHNVPISFTYDSYTVNKLSSEDGSVVESINIDVPATLYKNSFYVPLRAFCETVGSDFITITWDNSSRKVYLQSNDLSNKVDSSTTNTTTSTLTGTYRAYTNDDAHEGIANLDIKTNNDGTITMTYGRRHDIAGYNIGPISMNPQGDGTYIVQGENRSYVIKPVDENTVLLTIDDGSSETLTFIRL